MKKRIKSLLAFLLALTMVLSLAACGNKAVSGDPTQDKPNATEGEAEGTKEGTKEGTEETPTEEPATPTPEPDLYEAFDFGGREIKVGIWWDYFYTSEHSSVADNPQVGNTETAQMQLDNVRRIEEKYKCTIKFVNLGWSGIMSSINTSIAAGTPECDIYLTDLQFGIPAVFKGLAQDLTKLAGENSDLFGANEIVKPMQMGTYEGTYLFQEQGLSTTGIFLGYNATMIQDLGLEDPQALFEKGEWTWEKFAEYAKKGTRDLDNDGNTDVYGFGGIFTDVTNGLIMNNGGSLAGTTTEGLSSKPAMEAFEFIDRIYNIDKSGRPWNETDWDDNLLAWSDGKVMFWTAQAWSLKQEMDAAIKEGEELPFEFHVVPYPQGPSGDGKVYSPWAGNWYMIPVGVKEPEKVLQVFEEFLNWHGKDPEYRDDPTWFESCFTTAKDMEIALMTGENLKFDPWSSLSPYFDYGAAIWWPIVVRNDMTVAQSVESGKTLLQSALDNFIYKKK